MSSPSVVFLLCENRSCGLAWVAAAHYTNDTDATPSLVDPADAWCPDCKTQGIWDEWGKRGCELKRVIKPGEPLHLQKKPG